MIQQTSHDYQMNDIDSIAVQAELETWQDIRNESRRRLTVAISLAAAYLLGAVAVGSYLVSVVSEIAKDSMVLRSYWDWETIDLFYFTQMGVIYIGLAVMIVLGYALMAMLIWGKLPVGSTWIIDRLPGVGATMRMVVMSELCTSFYGSMLRSLAYTEAFDQASNEVENRDVSRWAKRCAKRVEAGHPLGAVLLSSPVRDQPLSIVSALLSGDQTQIQSAHIWHQAATECHLLAQSRMERTVQVLSVASLLASALIAFFAVLVCGTVVRSLLEGYLWVGAWF